MTSVRWVEDPDAVALWVADGPDEIVVHIPPGGASYDDLIRVGQRVFDKHGIVILRANEHLLPMPASNSERN